LNIFTPCFGSTATLFFAAVAASSAHLVRFNNVSREIQEISRRQKKISKRKMELLDEMIIMAEKAHQSLIDINRVLTETDEKRKAMWAAFWRNLVIEIVVLTGLAMVYAAYRPQ
jgi:hypothetical protein